MGTQKPACPEAHGDGRSREVAAGRGFLALPCAPSATPLRRRLFDLEGRAGEDYRPRLGRIAAMTLRDPGILARSFRLKANAERASANMAGAPQRGISRAHSSWKSLIPKTARGLRGCLIPCDREPPGLRNLPAAPAGRTFRKCPVLPISPVRQQVVVESPAAPALVRMFEWRVAARHIQAGNPRVPVPSGGQAGPGRHPSSTTE